MISVSGYRRPKNLKDILVKAKLTTDTTNSDSSRIKHVLACKARNCRYCPKLDKGGNISQRPRAVSTMPKPTWHAIATTLSTASSANVVANNIMWDRPKIFRSHFYYIAHDAEKTEVSRHFSHKGHKGLNDVSKTRAGIHPPRAPKWRSRGHTPK